MPRDVFGAGGAALVSRGEAVEIAAFLGYANKPDFAADPFWAGPRPGGDGDGLLAASAASSRSGKNRPPLGR